MRSTTTRRFVARAAAPTNIFGFTTTPEDAALVIVGVPWEPTVSYGRGTSRTPACIARASQQVDLYDGFAARSVGAEVALLAPREHWCAANARACAAARRGDVAAVNAASAQLNAELHAQVTALLAAGKRVGVLGGDHACSLGALAAVADAHGEIGVLQIDAHHDLRTAYEGYRYSHASAMANVLDEIPAVTKLVAVGVRDYARSEHARAEAEPRVTTFYDRALAAERFRGRAWHAQCEDIIAPLPARVYLSFDVDGLDPRFCPHTGTPVPGGLGFREATHLLETLRASGRTLVGFDLCEVAPAPTVADGDGSVPIYIGRGDGDADAGDDGGDADAAADWDLNVAARLLHKFAALSLA